MVIESERETEQNKTQYNSFIFLFILMNIQKYQINE